MDEINPYATPASSQDAKPVRPSMPRGYWLYKWISLSYSALTLLLSAMAVHGDADFSFASIFVLLVLNTPLVSYLLVAGGWRRLFYSWSSLHVLGVLALLAFAIEALQPDDPSKAVWAALVGGANLLSLLATGYFIWRLRSTDEK